MRLGEALSLRARQAQKLEDLRGRIKANALSQEGEAPAEDPYPLIEEFKVVSDEHSQLLAQIARTNMVTNMPGGGRLMDALHQRENLRRKRNLLEMAANASTPSRSDFRYMRSELRYVPRLDVATLRGEVEGLDQQVREIDARVQELNWLTDLLD